VKLPSVPTTLIARAPIGAAFRRDLVGSSLHGSIVCNFGVGSTADAPSR
jgi:hypothetical protein